jgi:hypothetical protein
MSMLINPHRFGAAGGVSPITGVLATRITSGTSTSPAPWNDEAYDYTGWHDNSTNPSQATVPSGVTKARVIANMNLNASADIGMLKNGATFRGYGAAGADLLFQNIVSAPVTVSAGDYFEADHSAATLQVEEACWMSVEKFDATLKGALVYRSTTLALSAGTFATVGFDTEDYDTDGFHDNVTNNTRLTVPSGVSAVRVSGGVRLTGSSGGQTIILFQKNGASVAGLVQKDADGGSDDRVNAISGIIEVSAGDYFEMQAFSTNAATLSNGDGTWFSIEEVPSTVKRCLAIRSANQVFTAGVEAAVIWDGADIYDTDSIHDPASNNTRFTVPSGCTEARMSFGLVTPNTAGGMRVYVKKNGARFYGGAYTRQDTAGSESNSGISAWVPVSAGDYFEVFFRSDSNNVTLGALTLTSACFEGR